MLTKKQTALIILTLCVAFGGIWFHWRRGVAYTQEEMLELVRREERIEDACVLTLLGDHEDEALGRLLCLEARDPNYPRSSARYYAVDFRPQGGAWAYNHSYLLLERGVDMYILSWGNGYFFLTGNPDNKAIRIKPSGGEETIVPVPQTPFCWYAEGEPGSFVYEFLDGEGKTLST